MNAKKLVEAGVADCQPLIVKEVAFGFDLKDGNSIGLIMMNEEDTAFFSFSTDIAKKIITGLTEILERNKERFS